MMQYVTKQGDVLDDVVNRQYGVGTWAVVQQVLDANPGLAEHGAVLPAGLLVTLPEIQNPTTTTKSVALWD